MSDRSMSKAEYLAAVFAKGILEDTHAVLALRAQYLHAKSPRAVEDKRESGPAREEVSAGLYALGEDFYGMEQEELFERLQSLPCDSFPDLARFKKRLDRVANALPTIWQADEDSALNPRLWNTFKELLVSPHAQATEQRRKISQSLTKRAAQRRTVKFAKRIKRRYPDLYGLESTWFGHLIGGKKIVKDSRRPASVGLGCLGAYGIFYVISKVIKMFLVNE